MPSLVMVALGMAKVNPAMMKLKSLTVPANVGPGEIWKLADTVLSRPGGLRRSVALPSARPVERLAWEMVRPEEIENPAIFFSS